MPTIVREPITVNDKELLLTVATTNTAVGRALFTLFQSGYPFDSNPSITGSDGLTVIEVLVNAKGVSASLNEVVVVLRKHNENHKIVSGSVLFEQSDSDVVVTDGDESSDIANDADFASDSNSASHDVWAFSPRVGLSDEDED